MRLFIAEKPSMGAEIAKQLKGPHNRKDGYIETSEGTVTWLFGHILRTAEPEEYNPKYKIWTMEGLPIIPEEWNLIVTNECKKQYKIIKDLIKKATEIVHAGDPDREGQLLVDEVLEYLNNKKPVYRLLLNALDEKSIKKALTELKNNNDFQNLRLSALARQRADWLVGMNLTRVYTLAARKAGHNGVFVVGRVKTPTMALVVRREQDIANFKPIDHYQIKATFSKNDQFAASWKPKEDQPGKDSENRIIDKSIIESVIEKIRIATNKPQITEYETKEKKEEHRLPFSLSALQIYAGKRFGYDPQTVLNIAQNLYEKKLTTYPRSDCDYLPENQHEDAKNILANLKASADSDLKEWVAAADIKIKSRAWNDKKITAHHAIIPTEQSCKIETLPEAERNIYKVIAQAYIAQFYPVHTYSQTTIKITHAHEDFTVTGRTIKNLGWKTVYKDISEKYDKEDSEDIATLPTLNKGDFVEFIKVDLITKTTKPPERFTTSTLLQAMKDIHKYVKNEDLKKQLKDVSGIGTEATRATIIAELIKKGFLKEVKKKLYPTEQANTLMQILHPDLTYPDTTAIWEMVLAKMAQGKVTLDNFMNKQINYITILCKSGNDIKAPVKTNSNSPKCPKCEGGFLRPRKGKNGPFWGCNRYPDCNATYPDNKGKPDLNPAPRKAK